MCSGKLEFDIPLGGIVSMEFHLEEDGNENGVSEAF